MDVCIIDLPWNGWIQGKRVADMAEAYEINIAPHNHYSHLADTIAAQFCGTLPNVQDHGDRDRRCAVEEGSGDGAADDPGWVHLGAERPWLGHGDERGRAAGASVAATLDAVSDDIGQDEQDRQDRKEHPVDPVHPV